MRTPTRMLVFVLAAILTAAYGDAAESSDAPGPSLGFYNYGAAALGERSGIARFAYDAASGRFRRDGVALRPEQIRRTGTSGWIKSPSAIRHGASIYLYFAVYDGSAETGWNGVGLAILDENGRNPRVAGIVLPRQPSMGFYGTEFPRVVKHGGTWHMWVAHDPTIGYASSRDGVRWTYHGDFDLPSARFNGLARNLGSVVRRDGWWWAFTMELDDEGRWHSDVVRARSPMGPWRRVLSNGPSHPRRDVEHSIARIEGRHVVLDEPAGLVRGEPVYLLETGAPVNSTTSQLNRVVAIEGDRVTLARPAAAGKTVIRTWAWDSYVTHLWRDRRGWRALGTAFHSGYPREHTLMLRAERGLAGPWSLLPMMPIWPGSWFGDEGSADWWSGENPVLVR